MNASVSQYPNAQKMLWILVLFSVSGVFTTSIKRYTIVADPVEADTVIETLPSMKLYKSEENTLYYIGAIFKGSWYQAMQFCRYHDMDVVSIETADENKFLFDRLMETVGPGDHHFWTSGTNLPNDHWVWMSTGRNVIYGNWLAGQPDNAGAKENCLEVATQAKTIVWNDLSCYVRHGVICETTMLKSVSKAVLNHENSNLTFIDVRSS